MAQSSDAVDMQRANQYGDLATQQAGLDQSSAQGMLGVGKAQSDRLAQGVGLGESVDTTRGNLQTQANAAANMALTGMRNSNDYFVNRFKTAMDASQTPFNQFISRVQTTADLANPARQAAMVSDAWVQALGADASLFQDEMNSILASGKLSAESKVQLQQMLAGAANVAGVMQILRANGIGAPSSLAGKA